MKAYLDVAAIRVRTSTQGSNLFQLLERASGRRDRNGNACALGRVRVRERERVSVCKGVEPGGSWLNLGKVTVSQMATWLPLPSSLPPFLPPSH